MDIDDRTEAFHRTVAHLLNLEILNHHSFRLAIRMAYAKMVWPEKFDEMISLLESEYGSGHVRSILRFSEPSQTTITTPQSS